MKMFGALVDSEWPAVDEKALQQEFVDITIQINGKSRGRIKIPASASDDQVLKIAQDSKDFKKYCQDKYILMTNIVPNRLNNIFVKILESLVFYTSFLYLLAFNLR